MSKSLRTVGVIMDKEGGGSKDIRNRRQKARGAFQRLWKMCEQPEESEGEVRYAYSRL